MAAGKFTYTRYSLDVGARVASFSYRLEHEGTSYDFTETLEFPLPLLDSPAQHNSLRALHLALGVSYYKIFIPSEIVYEYGMSAVEADFWNDVWRHGLGEFLYVNKLSADQLGKFKAQAGPLPGLDLEIPDASGALLGIGGGKDSAVAGELLKAIGVPVQGFVMATGEQLGQTQSVAATMQVPLHVVKRSLDKQLLEVQELPGAYKGHVPISLIFGLVGTALAVATHASYVVVANESSASIPRVTWENQAVNHQWSKSFGFEKSLQAYIQTTISHSVTYFSAIRSLGSIAVAKLFAGLPQYFEVFTSDNFVFRIDPGKRPSKRWGLESPKSLSSFMLLSPWLSEADMLRTFDLNFLDVPELEGLFLRLTGLEGEPPLDCVGTVEELVLSLNLAAAQGKFTESRLMQLAHERNLLGSENYQALLHSELQPQIDQAIPAEIITQLNAEVALRLQPQKQWDSDAFAGKDVVFVGAGKGRSMASLKDFIEKHGNIASFSGVDKQNGDKPLNFLLDYDANKTVFIKNEGIPGTEMTVPYVTPMQIFFELVAKTGATTIGITGTKGKSTTTALTAHILQEAGKHVVLAGNIGIGSPMTALETAAADAVFVLELSSYQLSDLHVSPHISACINLYNDHSDWHGSMDQYWEAKHNIMRFAGSGDVFIYNPDFAALQEWADAAHCQTVAINPSEPLDMEGAQLYGDHNRLNALVAREIARQCGVSDGTSLSAIKSFETLRHRMQTVAVKQGRTYIDDAIGMTPESTTASLAAVQESIGQVGCLLLGGQDRDYDFTSVMQAVAHANIPHLVLFPDTIEKMKAALPEGYHPEIYESNSMAEAVAYARDHAPDGSVVLLSTAAPSYSLWKDFEDKGDQFQAAVFSLTE